MAKNTDDSSGSTRKSELRQISEIFRRHGVEFIVIGGQAETLMGSPRVTVDVDLCYLHTPENCGRLSASLQELNAKLRDIQPEIPFQLDQRTLQMGSNFTFTTEIIDLDMLAWVEPIGDYAAILKNAEVYLIGDMQIPVINLEDLIKVKQHINRPKDRDSLFHLLAIKRIRQEMNDASPADK